MKSHSHLDSIHDSRKDKTWRLFRKKKIQEFRGLGEGRVRQAGQRGKGLGTVARSGNQAAGSLHSTLSQRSG